MGELIQKQAMLHAIEKCHKKCCRTDSNGDEWIHYETALNELEALPPVQPKRGKWIERGTWSEGYGMGESYGKYWACDQCGREAKGFWNECGNNFCSNCGADMRERGVSNAVNN